MNAERRDRGGIDGFYHTHAVAFGGESHENFIRIGHNFLHHDLLVVLFSERSEVISGKISVACLDGFQRNNFVAGFRRRPWLSADHAAESCNPPRPHVIVFAANRDEILLRQRHLDHRRLVNCEGLKQLWTVSDRLRMLHDDLDRATLGAVRDFDPISRQT